MSSPLIDDLHSIEEQSIEDLYSMQCFARDAIIEALQRDDFNNLIAAMSILESVNAELMRRMVVIYDRQERDNRQSA